MKTLRTQRAMLMMEQQVKEKLVDGKLSKGTLVMGQLVKSKLVDGKLVME